ncbi:hypothetical protein FAZ69_26995 [Trinickia terrae]|uniref:Uncharacterized protein n=1 Tax=Trinickia terrae TaxID=2571161 RepID=A0A4U1HK70_9BURK|nr:hypothetical protein [Trinickia terrae]TKC81619.1 hypothetical protein FAZ69_26995 [Trinickia terrae]
MLRSTTSRTHPSRTPEHIAGAASSSSAPPPGTPGSERKRSKSFFSISFGSPLKHLGGKKKSARSQGAESSASATETGTSEHGHGTESPPRRANVLDMQRTTGGSARLESTPDEPGDGPQLSRTNARARVIGRQPAQPPSTPVRELRVTFSDDVEVHLRTPTPTDSDESGSISPGSEEHDPLPVSTPDETAQNNAAQGATGTQEIETVEENETGRNDGTHRATGNPQTEIVEENETARNDNTQHTAGNPQTEIVEENETGRNTSTANTNNGETAPQPAGRPGADLPSRAHEVRHANPYHVSTDTTILGLSTTTKPSRPMSLPIGGPKLNPAPAATPAESLDPPPLAPAEAGLRQSKKLKAAKAFVRQLFSPDSLRGKRDAAARGKTQVEEIAPAFTTRAALDTHMKTLFPEQAEALDALAAELHDSLPGAGQTAEQATEQAATAQTVDQADRQSSGQPANRNTTPPHTELQFTHHMLISERLAQVTEGQAERASAAIDALKSGLFLPLRSIHSDSGPQQRAELRDLMRLNSNRSTFQQAQVDALSTAARLAASPAGYDALMRLMGPRVPEHRRADVKRLLEAVAKVEAERGKPADLAVHASTARGAVQTGQATLAQQVLDIEARVLDAPDDAPHTLRPSDKAALFSWDNGFHESGPGTELAKVQGRLAKMSKYVQRANHLQDLRNVKFERNDMVRSTAKVLDAKARILATRAQQVIGRKKSPLTGLRKFGANNDWLMHPDDDATRLDENAAKAVKILREHYQPDPAVFAPDVRNERARALPEKVVVAAVLEHWESLVAREDSPMRPLGNKLDQAALGEIAQKIATRYGVDNEAARSRIEGHLQRWAGSKTKLKFKGGFKLEREVSRELTVKDLKKWAADANVQTVARTLLGEEIDAGKTPQQARTDAQARADAVAAADAARAEAGVESSESAAPSSAPHAPTRLVETEFGEALRRSLAIVDQSAVRPDDLTPDGLHRFTRAYLQEHNWGNPLTASNGGTAGINTASISETVHRLAKKVLPFTATPVLDLRLGRTSNAVMAIGSTTHGGEIFIGSQRQVGGSLGAGMNFAVGPGKLKKILGQLNFGAEVTPLLGEAVKTRGVMVRVLRPPKSDRSGFDTAAARDELVRFNDLVWGIAKGEHGDLNPEKMWEHIAGEFFESKTISIGWQDQEALNIHHSVNASVGLRGGHALGKTIAGAFGSSEVVRAGVSAGYSADLTTFGSNQRKEETGRNRLARANFLWRFQQNGTAGVSLSTPAVPLSHAQGAVTSSLASGATSVTRNYQLSDMGFNATFRAIVKEGKLSEHYTLREFEERQAKAFVAFLTDKNRHAQFTEVFKATYGAEKGPQEFKNFLEKAKNWAGPGQHFVTRYRLSEVDRKKIDELAAVAHGLHESNPEHPMLASIAQAIEARLADESAWRPMQTFALEAQTARATKGINLGLQLSAADTVASDRELSAVVVPLPIANAWVKARMREPMPEVSTHHPRTETTAGA